MHKDLRASFRYSFRALKNLIRPPYHIHRPYFPPQDKTLTNPLLVVCGPGFNQDKQTAATLMREGFARGWSQACGPARLVAASRLIETLEEYNSPAVFMSPFEFDSLDCSDVKRLRSVDLFVWVGVHPRSYKILRRYAPLPPEGELARELSAYAKIMLAEPKFVWNAVGQSGAEWYQGWRDDGLRWETVWPAADDTRYFPESDSTAYGHIKMAYVGGYWAEKAPGVDLYLRPWQEILWTFGYARWPYKYYGGGLSGDAERQLYSSAGLIPLVTGPLGWVLAEITERYLKAPACKAFCISDENPALREIFSESEMLQAHCPEEFHELVRLYLSDQIDTHQWRTRGYEAVQQRHLYRHRALQINEALSVACA